MRYTQLYYTDIQHIAYISYNIFQISTSKIKDSAFYMCVPALFVRSGTGLNRVVAVLYLIIGKLI